MFPRQEIKANARAAFTFGLLSIFYVGPYVSLAKAGAYDYLKRTRMI